MATTSPLPETMKALVLQNMDEPPTVKVVSTPKATAGSAVIRILVGTTTNFMQAIYTGKLKVPLSKPLIPGTSAIGRVVTVGPDSTKIKPGDLVYFDCVIRSRDDPTDVYLSAVPFTLTESAKKLRDCYSSGAFAEYCLTPLENLYPINEARITGSPIDGGLGYTIEQLAHVGMLLVPYGGLKDIDVQAGQTIIIAPATGCFGGYAVLCAQAMGARAIAMGRNKDALAKLKESVPHPERLETVAVTGDMEADLAALQKFGPIDAFFEMGPPQASSNIHIKSAILSLRHGARVSFMGGYHDDILIPYGRIMSRNIQIFGRYMYERSYIRDMFGLIENGLLDLGVGKITGEFPLEQWEDAWRQAAENSGLANMAVIKP